MDDLEQLLRWYLTADCGVEGARAASGACLLVSLSHCLSAAKVQRQQSQIDHARQKRPMHQCISACSYCVLLCTAPHESLGADIRCCTLQARWERPVAGLVCSTFLSFLSFLFSKDLFAAIEKVSWSSMLLLCLGRSNIDVWDVTAGTSLKTTSDRRSGKGLQSEEGDEGKLARGARAASCLQVQRHSLASWWLAP